MVKAQIVVGDASEPIQVQMSAEEALALAYIANDFVISGNRSTPETERLSGFASLLASRLQDVLVARTAMPARPAVAVDADAA